MYSHLFESIVICMYLAMWRFYIKRLFCLFNSLTYCKLKINLQRSCITYGIFIVLNLVITCSMSVLTYPISAHNLAVIQYSSTFILHVFCCPSTSLLKDLHFSLITSNFSVLCPLHTIPHKYKLITIINVAGGMV